jgi:hypothetical protein
MGLSARDFRKTAIATAVSLRGASAPFLIFGRRTMKVNFSAPMVDLDGKPILQGAEGSEPAQLKHVALIALGNASDPKQPDDAAKKMRCFDLMVKIANGGELELTPEDAALIKEKIGIGYPPLIMGRAFEHLNG